MARTAWVKKETKEGRLSGNKDNIYSCTFGRPKVEDSMLQAAGVSRRRVKGGD